MSELSDKDRRKFKQDVAKHCPLAYQAFFGRKYLLPNYRSADYGNQEFESMIEFDRVAQFAAMILDPRDEVQRASLGTTLASLHYKRPTLFLERELGEAFLRAPLPGDFTTGDIKWRWGAFKVWLPLGLIKIEREDGIRTLTHFNITRIGPSDHKVFCPPEIARELDRFSARMNQSPNFRILEKTDLLYEEDGISVSAALDWPENPAITQTVYGLTKPWGKINVAGMQAVKGSLKTPIGKDEADDKLLARLEYLVLQVLLYLGAVPIEYEAQPRMIRPMKREGKNLHPGLFDARFVGQSQLRPYKPSTPHATMIGAGSTGRHFPAHVVSGHWKRVVHGPKGSERRLQWIMTYITKGQPEEEDKQSLAT